MKGSTSIVLAMIIGVVGVIYFQIAEENAYNKGKSEGLATLRSENEAAYQRGWKASEQECQAQMLASEKTLRKEFETTCNNRVSIAQQQTKKDTESRLLEQAEKEKMELRDSFKQATDQLYAQFDSLMRDSLLAVTTFLRNELSDMVNSSEAQFYQQRKEESKIHISPDWYLDSGSRLKLLGSTTRVRLMPLLSLVGMIFIALLILHGIFSRKSTIGYRRR